MEGMAYYRCAALRFYEGFFCYGGLDQTHWDQVDDNLFQAGICAGIFIVKCNRSLPFPKIPFPI